MPPPPSTTVYSSVSFIYLCISLTHTHTHQSESLNSPSELVTNYFSRLRDCELHFDCFLMILYACVPLEFVVDVGLQLAESVCRQLIQLETYLIMWWSVHLLADDEPHRTQLPLIQLQ